MSPWLLLVGLVAIGNFGLLVAIRGRWGRLAPLLLLGAVLGSAGGDWLGAGTGLELIRIGDFHLVAASVGAQLAMLAVLLLANLGPTARDGSPAGR